MTERVSEQNIQKINQENRANLNQWELNGVCPDDENEIPTLICPYCGHEFPDMFNPTCPKCGKDF